MLKTIHSKPFHKKVTDLVNWCGNFFSLAGCASMLFDLVDHFAESSKRKAAVWPLQIMLLILCPVRIQRSDTSSLIAQHHVLFEEILVSVIPVLTHNIL